MVWMPHWPFVSETPSIKLGLERVKSLLEVLDNPQNKMPPVIHVTGTNGKGSTVAYLRSILEKAGLKVHVYTSPHLTRFNERIVLAGNEISDAYLYEILEECRIAVERNNVDISFFEGVTAAAFLAFSRVRADICLIEVGMGGRLDATNVFEKPLVTIITPISLDHTNVLGGTIAQIAFEKAFIMKPNCPSVISMQTDEASKVLEQYAEINNVPLFRYEYDFGIELNDDESFNFLSDKIKMLMLKPSLPGFHQYVNAASAIAAILLLKNINISEKNIAEAISTTKWPGRLQKVDSGNLRKKLSENCELYLDGAHNPSGAQVLAVWVKSRPKRKTYLIYNMTKNRDVLEFLKYFDDLDIEIICTDIYSEPLAYKSEFLLEMVKGKYATASSALSIKEAMEKIALNTTSDSRIIITGSLFLVADALNNN
jgi:dihydrofolate synthase/folylpolyglutamate synthase